MAIAIPKGRHHRAPRPPWMRRRPPEHQTILAAFMVALALTSVTIVVRSVPAAGGAGARTGITTLWWSVPTRPREGAVPATAAALPVATPEHSGAPHTPLAATSPSERGPTAPILAAGTRALVVNTDGVGVILRTAPRAGARRPTGLAEGTSVTVLELADGEWARVESDTRQAGWVPIAFLSPTD